MPSQNLLHSLNANGFVVLKKALPVQHIALFQEAIATTLENNGINIQLIDSELNVKNPDVDDIDIVQSLDQLIGKKEFLLLQNELQSIVSTQIFSSELRPVDWNAIRVNTKTGRLAVHWHQDIQTAYENKLPFYKDEFFTVWAPISNSNIGNSIEISEASHLPRIIHKNHYRLNIDLPAIHISKKLYQADCQPGDIIVLDSFVFHRSIPNNTNRTRFSIDYRFSTGKKAVDHVRSFEI